MAFGDGVFLARGRGFNGFSYRERRVQKLNDSFELLEYLSPRALEILKSLGAGNNETSAARAARCCKSNVTYWKDKLVAMGALRLQWRDFSQTFTLTSYGSKLLTGSEGGVREVVGLEDYAVKFLVLEDEKRRIDWRKLGCPRNWVKLGVRIGGVRVVKTSRHVIIHPGKLKGFDTTELKVEAGRIIESVKSVLENRFGMTLSAECVPLHKPIYEFYSEEARELSEFGTFNVRGVGSINKSPPSRIPHEEYVEEIANEKLLLPLTARRVEKKIDFQTENVSKLVDGVGKLVDALGRLTGPAGENRPQTEVGKYVF
jgi:hypothetical protein